MSDDLVAFLRARLDEDEAGARMARPEYFTVETLAMFSSAGDAQHVIRHDPARVLREVAATRQLIDLHAGPHECAGGEDAYGKITAYERECPTLRLLAACWSDHPDFRPQWRP